MNQTIKYGTDEYGNVWSALAQIEPVGGTPCYRIDKESLEEPPECPNGKRPIVDNGSWKIIPIAIDCIWEDGVIRHKNSLELMRDGLEEIPKGMKIVAEGVLKLEPKTLEEMLKTNEIPQEEYKILKNMPVILKLEEIDKKSVRALREWYSSQSGCPEVLKSLETCAIKIRKELL